MPSELENKNYIDEFNDDVPKKFFTDKKRLK